MFEQQRLDEDARKRQVVTLGVMWTVAGLMVCGVSMVAWEHREQLVELVPDTGPMERERVWKDIDVTGLAPPPPPPAAAAAVEPTTLDSPQEVDQPVDIETTLNEPTPQPVRSTSQPPGAAGGRDGGVEDGVDGGVDGGDPRGTVGSTGGGGGLTIVHHSKLKAKVAVRPRYPPSALEAGLGSAQCRVQVQIDAKGVPSRWVVTDCPDVFRVEVDRALERSRWYPHRVKGRKQPAETTLMIRFQP